MSVGLENKIIYDVSEFINCHLSFQTFIILHYSGFRNFALFSWYFMFVKES